MKFPYETQRLNSALNTGLSTLSALYSVILDEKTPLLEDF